MILERPLVLPSGQVLANRIAKSAMSERLAGPDGSPNDGHQRSYAAWAAGGPGLLVSGNILIDARRLGEPGNVAVEDDTHLGALADWARSVGSVPLWGQINHPGRQATRALDPAPVAPSVVPMKGTYGVFATPRALTDSEVQGIVERFATTADVLRRAGFGGVQIHAAHGYLVNQFLSPRTNLRDDRWGGSLERRMAFLIAIVRAIRERSGAAFPISVKLNTADFQRGGFETTDAVEVARALEGERIDLLELSGGTYERAAMFAEGPPKESTRSREAYFLDQAEVVRAAVKTPLMLTGGFRTRRGMEEALASGVVDVVGLARPLALEPDLPRRLLDGSASAARPVQLATGLAHLDSMTNGAWYQVQIERLASGRAPDPDLWRLRALAWYLRDAARGRAAVPGSRRAAGALRNAPA